MYINDVVIHLKEACGFDGFLSWLHCLLLMDDTVVSATTREKAIAKVKVLLSFLDILVINVGNPKFMVINGRQEERRPISSAIYV